MSMPTQPGEVIAGKYVIERLLGQGGMGAVFVATQEQLGRRVAIKFLLGDAMHRPESVARFEREARAAAALESDHVTRVLDVGHLSNGAPYIVMELLDGEDLAATLHRRGPLPLADAIDAIVQACDAIAEAHALGIVHRDLKPANLFLARRANGATTVKVLDFGISKKHEPTSGAALTSTAALMGSPQYMSPEQLRESRNVDGRSDVWALGVTLHELLTQRFPFEAEALAELCAQILTAPHAPLRAHRPDLPGDIEAIVSRCLQKDPQQRFGTVAELVAALQRVQPHVSPSSARVVISVPSFVQTNSAVDGEEDTRRKSIDTLKVSQPRTMSSPRAMEARFPVAAAVAICVVVLGVALKVGVSAFGHPASTESKDAPVAASVALPPSVDAAVAVTSSTLPPIPLPEPPRPSASPPAPKRPSAGIKPANPLDLPLQ